VGYLVYEGKIYFSQDVTGFTGTLVYALAAVLVGHMATRINPERIFLRGLLIAGLAVAFFPLLGGFSGAAGSFLLLQVSLAFVDVFFWIALLVVAARFLRHATGIVGTALALYTAAGFLPAVLMPPGRSVLPHAFLAAAIFLIAVLVLIDVALGRTLLPELDLSRLWDSAVSFGPGDCGITNIHDPALLAERMEKILDGTG